VIWGPCVLFQRTEGNSGCFHHILKKLLEVLVKHITVNVAVLIPWFHSARSHATHLNILFNLRTSSARKTVDATPCMIISSDREHCCFLIYPVKIITLRNWPCRPLSLAVPALRTLFNKTGNVGTARHCGAMVQPLLRWKSNKHFTF
jgi:hypothetical protein